MSEEYELWTTRKSVAVIVVGSLALWALLWLAVVAFASPASAGMTCRQIGNSVVCADDGGGRTTCRQIGNAVRCS